MHHKFIFSYITFGIVCGFLFEKYIYAGIKKAKKWKVYHLFYNLSGIKTWIILFLGCFYLEERRHATWNVHGKTLERASKILSHHPQKSRLKICFHHTWMIFLRWSDKKCKLCGIYRIYSWGYEGSILLRGSSHPLADHPVLQELCDIYTHVLRCEKGQSLLFSQVRCWIQWWRNNDQWIQK